MNNELPKRKIIRLKKFDYSSVGAYFITICTQDKKPILSQIVKSDNKFSYNTNDIMVGDGAFDVPRVQLTRIGEIVERNLLSSRSIEGVFIDDYVIMPDHIHAIIIIKKDTTRNGGTSRAPSPTNEMLPHIVSTFKRFCNKEIGSNIFQRSFFDHIIRDQDDYETRRKYIYENPLKWYYENKQNPIF